MIVTNTSILLANADDQTKKVWLDLPFDEDDFADAMNKIDVEVSEKTDEDVDLYDLIVSGKSIDSGYVMLKWVSDFTELDENHFDNIFSASDLVERIESLEPYQEDVLKALIEDGASLEEAIEETEDGDVEFYPDTDLETLAQQFGDEEMFSKEYLLEHIDWEAVARDLEFDGYTEVSGGVLRRR